jgi:hypothetical protein
VVERVHIDADITLLEDAMERLESTNAVKRLQNADISNGDALLQNVVAAGLGSPDASVVPVPTGTTLPDGAVMELHKGRLVFRTPAVDPAKANFVKKNCICIHTCCNECTSTCCVECTSTCCVECTATCIQTP